MSVNAKIHLDTAVILNNSCRENFFFNELLIREKKLLIDRCGSITSPKARANHFRMMHFEYITWVVLLAINIKMCAELYEIFIEKTDQGKFNWFFLNSKQ